MGKSIKASLLSALVFPGVGHFFLKRFTVGAILALTAFSVLVIVISAVLDRAMGIVEKIERGEVQPDYLAIVELLSKQQPGTEAQLVTVATFGFILIWIIGIVDCYRVGRVIDKSFET